MDRNDHARVEAGAATLWAMISRNRSYEELRTDRPESAESLRATVRAVLTGVDQYDREHPQ